MYSCLHLHRGTVEFLSTVFSYVALSGTTISAYAVWLIPAQVADPEISKRERKCINAVVFLIASAYTEYAFYTEKR